MKRALKKLVPIVIVSALLISRSHALYRAIDLQMWVNDHLEQQHQITLGEIETRLDRIERWKEERMRATSGK